MPIAPPRPGGSKLPKTTYDDHRQSAAKRGYGHRWRRARAWFLKSNPLCVECEGKDIVKPATVVDHIKPHRGDRGLFWDKGNWQALCKPCHDRKTRGGA